jgi:hypothetical protein
VTTRRRARGRARTGEGAGSIGTRRGDKARTRW